MRIDYRKHALFRINERARQFGLENEDLLERIISTIKRGKLASRHRRSGTKTFYCYYPDGLTVYVITRSERYGHLVVTVIIERGRP